MPLVSIQVYGGGEFTAEFKAYCQASDIPLDVLPSRRPQYKGCVERANATTRYVFYPHYHGPLNLDAVNHGLQRSKDHYKDTDPPGTGPHGPKRVPCLTQGGCLMSHMY